MTPPNQKASLGCGTLILIALIVLIFGNANRGNDKQLTSQFQNLQSRIGSLSSEVNSLKNTIRKQSDDLTRIQQSLDEINNRAGKVRPRIVAVPGSIDSPPLPPEATLPEN